MIAKEYWRLWHFSKIGVMALALFAILSVFISENFRVKREQPYYKDKIQASKLASLAFEILQPEIKKKKKFESKETDPAGSGLVGEFLTPVTSNSGSLSAKQTSINPNFAAVFIYFLKKAGLREGDTIAVATTGSFPAVNICLYAAIETLKLRPIVISSASSSQYGANNPDMLWLDMENFLYLNRIFSTKSRFSSLGGIQDQAIGISAEGKRLLKEGIERNHISFLSSYGFSDSIQIRMNAYKTEANKSPLKLFVNIGGGTTIFGTSIGKQVFRNGLLMGLPEDVDVPDSVIKEFLSKEIPVLNVIQIETMARKFHLPIAPKVTPKAGEGKIFVQEEYNPWIVCPFIFILLGGLFVLTYGKKSSDLLPETIH